MSAHAFSEIEQSSGNEQSSRAIDSLPGFDLNSTSSAIALIEDPATKLEPTFRSCSWPERGYADAEACLTQLKLRL